jgi:hypothetical protein
LVRPKRRWCGESSSAYHHAKPSLFIPGKRSPDAEMGSALSRSDSEPLTTDFTDDTDFKHLEGGQEAEEKIHHLVSALPAEIVLCLEIPLNPSVNFV